MPQNPLAYFLVDHQDDSMGAFDMERDLLYVEGYYFQQE